MLPSAVAALIKTVETARLVWPATLATSNWYTMALEDWVAAS